MNLQINIPLIDLLRFHVIRLTAAVSGLLSTSLMMLLLFITDHVSRIKHYLTISLGLISINFEQLAADQVHQLVRQPFYITSIALLIIVPIILVNLVLIMISLFRFSRYYITISRASLIRLPSTIRKIFSPSLYRSLLHDMFRLISFGMFNLLVNLSVLLNAVPLFRNPWIIRTFFISLTRRTKIIIRPLSTVIQRIFDFITPGSNIDSTEEMLNLLDLSTEETETDHIPENVTTLFKETGTTEATTFIQKSWLEINDTLTRRFNSNLKTALLVSGPAGSGKSTFLDWLQRIHTDKPLVRINLKRDTDLFNDDYIKNLGSLDFEHLNSIKRQIVIVDDMELLFQRSIGGFDQLQKMLVLIERTKSRISWIISSNDCFLSFISNIHPLKSIFPFQLNLAEAPVEDILTSFTTILGKAGYTILIKPGPALSKEISKLIKSKNLGQDQVMPWLRERLFNNLYYSGGPVFPFYSFYLMRSILNVRKSSITLHEPKILELPSSLPIGSDTLFLLQSLFIHKWMSKEMLCTVLLQPDERISLILSLLYENNIIEKSDDLFRINPIFYQQVLERLKTDKLF